VPQAEARAELGVPVDAKVLVSVGTLVRRKGFHRVIACMPELLSREPNLLLLIVGGAGAEGDDSAELREQVARLGIEGRVLFLGPMPAERLRVPLSAADCFVLASSYEGWANVLLEAMACGLPVVATDVGGNAQVVASDRVGRIVPFDDAGALASALASVLATPWDRAAIRAYAEANAWDRRIPQLLQAFERLLAGFAGCGRDNAGDRGEAPC
jgi:glycosyltransferase involved in cell wall biosynthesis